jgi:hypothetical protein
VDRLIADHSLLGGYTIPPCWLPRLGGVEELAGLWRSWTRAMIAGEIAKPTAAMTLPLGMTGGSGPACAA